jgi:phosphomannomutase
MTLFSSYTAMHGVGYPFIQAAFHSFGLPPPIPVPLQVQPDPTFPTVKLPNPEEGAGALQLAFATAQDHKARLVVASDPDADRFVFAELQDDGSWRLFNGNEIGLMCAPPCSSDVRVAVALMSCASCLVHAALSCFVFAAALTLLRPTLLCPTSHASALLIGCC